MVGLNPTWVTRLGSVLLALTSAVALEPPPAWTISTLEPPPGVAVEAGGLAVRADGSLAVALRRGEVWIARDPTATNSARIGWTRFASGLHEPLGLAAHQGDLHTTQRGELTRLRDTDGDGVADEYLCVARGWGVSGNYHEYAYGPKIDPAGNFWVTLNCTIGEKFAPDLAWRGYGLRIDPTGAWKPISGGMRSPCGIGINAAGDVFFSEQQGNWNGMGGIHHIRTGAFHGHADSFASCSLPGAPFARPEPFVQRVSVPEAAARMPAYQPAAVWLPYRKMGMSATDLALDGTAGKFGPFAGQFFVGEFTQSGVNRVFLEKVDGQYQGACFPFLDGFACGVLRLAFLPDGSLAVGETNRGWNSLGPRSWGLQRVVWGGRAPFALQTLQARPTGFHCTFTRALDPASLPATSWRVISYTHLYTPDYGGPEIDVREHAVKAAQSAPDHRSITLAVDGLRAGYVHELRITGLRADTGEALTHPDAYYTLNRVPK